MFTSSTLPLNGFNFRKLPISEEKHRQLAGIHEDRKLEMLRRNDLHTDFHYNAYNMGVCDSVWAVVNGHTQPANTKRMWDNTSVNREITQRYCGVWHNTRV
jgi:hypothetical protein